MLNIITPCSRPQNLKAIEASINIPRGEFRWLVVCDSKELPQCYLPSIAEVYAHVDEQSICGNAQRNYALGLVESGHVYFNDDDTVLHPELWANINWLLPYHDFLSFMQTYKDGKRRLTGKKIGLGYTDSHNFVAAYELCRGKTWRVDFHGADGCFAAECYAAAQKPLYIRKVLSSYNTLR